MTRAFWIVGLSVALIVNTGFVAVCCAALATRGHLNHMGWIVLCISIYLVWQIVGWLRSAIKYGDPTRTAAAPPIR